MQPQAEESTRARRIILAILTLLVAITRLVPLSKTPWDWDEVLFCLAVEDYNVAAHQPHPPGFPLFIVLGKLARLFADSDFHALQAVTVLASTCVFPVMFRLARAFRLDFAASVGAALLFSFLPNVWFYGGTAFSDPLAMVLFLAAIAAYLDAGSSGRRYLLASVLLGAALLVRPQNALVIIFPWTLATVRLVRVKNLRAVAGGTLVAVLIAVTGYGAAAYGTGFQKYAEVFASHAGFVTRADTIVAVQYRPSIGEALLMQLDPYDAGKVSLLVNLLVLAALLFGRRKVVAEILLTFAPFFLFALLVVSPLGASRFSLNYMAGIVLLAVEGMSATGGALLRRRGYRESFAHGFFLAILLGRFISWVLPAFEVPRKTASPPVAAAMWVRDHVPPGETVFVHHNMEPWGRYYVREQKTIPVKDEMEIVLHAEAAHGWYLSMGVPAGGEGARPFVRPRNRTWNIVTQRGFEAFAIPAASVVPFGEGWFGLEWDGSSRWRWSSGRATLHLPPVAETYELRLLFDAPLDAIGKPMTVRFTVDGAPAAMVAAKQSGNEVRLVVPPKGKTTEVVLQTSETFVPGSRGGHDQRALGIMLHGWTWRPLARR